MSEIKFLREYHLTNLILDDFPLNVRKVVSHSDHFVHKHDFTELVMVERGKGVHLVEGFRHTISSGDMLTIPEGVRHGYENTETLEIVNVFFDMTLLDAFPGDFSETPGFHALFPSNPAPRKKTTGHLTLTSEDATTVEKMINDITRELRGRRAGHQSACVLTLARLIVFLCAKASRSGLGPHSNALTTTLEHMEKNHRQPMSLERLSRMTNLSPRSFQRLFRDYMGVSPFDHLMNIRLRHARTLLEESELNIGEIADTTGFGDASYFTRQFKKTFRLPPTAYRKQVAP